MTLRVHIKDAVYVEPADISVHMKAKFGLRDKDFEPGFTPRVYVALPPRGFHR